MKYSASLALVLLSGCGGRIDTPSLLPRPVEATRPDDAPAIAEPAPDDTAEAARIARLVEQARAADGAFESALPAAARSGPTGSEAWIAAQSARSAAEVARGPALDALTALDGEIAKATDEGRDPAAFIVARAEVQALVERQTARLERLSR